MLLAVKSPCLLIIWNVEMANVNQITVDEAQHDLLSLYRPLPADIRSNLLDIVNRFHGREIEFKQAEAELTKILQDNNLGWVLEDQPDFFKVGSNFVVAYNNPIIASTQMTVQLFLHARHDNRWTFGNVARGLKLANDPNKNIEDVCSQRAGTLPLMILQMQHYGLYDDYKRLSKQDRVTIPPSLKKTIERYDRDREEALAGIRIVLTGNSRSIFESISGNPRDPDHPKRKYVYGADIPEIPSSQDISSATYHDIHQLFLNAYGSNYDYGAMANLHHKIKETVGADKRLNETGSMGINSKYIFPGFSDDASDLYLLIGAVLTSPLEARFRRKSYKEEDRDLSALIQEASDVARIFYNKKSSQIIPLLDRLHSLGLIGYFEFMLFEMDHVLPTKLLADKLDQWKKLRIPKIEHELGLDIISPDPTTEDFNAQLHEYGYQLFKRDKIPDVAISINRNIIDVSKNMAEDDPRRKTTSVAMYYFGIYILGQHPDFSDRANEFFSDEAVASIQEKISKFNDLDQNERLEDFKAIKLVGLWGLFMRGLKDRTHSPFSQDVLEAANAFEKPVAVSLKPQANGQTPAAVQPTQEKEEPKEKLSMPRKKWKKDLSLKFGAMSVNDTWGSFSDYDARYVVARKNIRAGKENDFATRTGFEDTISNDNEGYIPDGFPSSLKDKLFFPKDGATIWGDGDEKNSLVKFDDEEALDDNKEPEFRWKFVLKALQGIGVTNDQILGVYNPKDQEFIFDIETAYGRSQIIVDDYREIFVVRDNMFRGEISLPFHRSEKKLPDGTFEDIGNKMYLLDNRYAWRMRLRGGSETLQEDLEKRLIEERENVPEQLKRQVSWTSNERGIQFVFSLISTVMRTSHPPKTQDRTKFEYGPLANLSGATPSKAYTAIKRGSVPMFEKEGVKTFGGVWNEIVKLEPELDSFLRVQPLQAHDVFQTVTKNISAGRAVDDFSQAVGSCKGRKAEHVSLAIKYDGIPSINEALKKAGVSQAAQDKVVDFESLMEATGITVQDRGVDQGWLVDRQAASNMVKLSYGLKVA